MKNEKIIIWDFSWIQKYLYDIKKNKSATKRLKWRSVFIELLLNKIENDLKIKLWNCEQYITSWWKFVLICKDFDENKFHDFKKDLENKLLKQFYGELKIIFGVYDYDQNDFKNTLNKAFEDLEKNKNRAFESFFIENWVWNSEKFIFEEKNDNWENVRWTDTVCSFSRWDLITYKKWFNNYIDHILEEEELDWIWQNTANDIIISNFIAWNNWWKNKINIFGNEKIELDEKIKKYLPKKWDKIKSFEELAWGWNFNKLACLKWDIDNLWKLFIFDLKDEDYYENYRKLSKKLDNFWDLQLYQLVKNRDIYIVYAWWDDFLILWKWDIIIEFYIELQNEFKKEISDNQEVKNVLKENTKTITFSWAINLFWPHDTFFTVVKQTDVLLKEAKEWDKNAINIFWKVIKNDEFDSLFQEIKKFEEEYKIYDKEKNIISTQTLRFLLDIAKKIILEDEVKNWLDKDWNTKNFFEYGLWKAELFYMLWRNYKTKSWNDDKDKFRQYIDGIILKNEDKIFGSLSWNNELFNDKAWEKIFIMMSYLLYKLRE